MTTPEDVTVKQLVIFDCQGRRMGTRQLIGFGADGRLISTKSTPEELVQRDEPVPGSSNEIAITAVCGALK